MEKTDLELDLLIEQKLIDLLEKHLRIGFSLIGDRDYITAQIDLYLKDKVICSVDQQLTNL